MSESSVAPAAGATPPEIPPPTRATFRALASRNFRLFFIGQGISLLGTWLARVATAWLVYTLVRGEGGTLADEAAAAGALALVGFAGLIPTFLFAPFAGVLVDRTADRFRLMTITQVLSLLQVAALAVLTLGGWITVPHIVALSVIQGLINAVDTPARQALVVDMVDRREDLANAIAINSGMFNGARFVGPAVAGVMLSVMNAGWCFAIDAVSYVAVIVSLLMMTRRLHSQDERRHPIHELREGFFFAFGFPPVRALLMVAGLMSLIGMVVQTLLPIFGDELKSTAGTPLLSEHGSRAYGLLLTAFGVGALVATVNLARRSSVLGLGRVVALAGIVGGVALIAFGYSHSLWLSVVLAAASGFTQISVMASSNTMLQTIVDDRMRGRLMSFFTMSVMGMAPFGSLLAGWFSGLIGPGPAVSISGACLTLGGVFFLLKLRRLRALVHPIYVERGVLPPVAGGLRAASQ